MDKTTYREPRVFMFYKSKVKTCSLEESKLFFKENFNLKDFNLEDFNLLDKYSFEKTFKKTTNDLAFDNKLIKKLNNKNFITQQVVPCLALTLFLSFNPNKCFSLSSLETFKETGTTVLTLINDIAIKGVLIFTAIKLGIEYINGANYYRILDILKECLGILLAILLLPKIPGFFNLLL